MREILFRGKTKNGGWAYGSLISTGAYCCILESEDAVHPNDYPYLDNDLGTIDGKATPVIPETVGQFTGLADSKGNKIFEGDIVRSACGYGFITNAETELVRWEKKSCGFEPFSDSLENCGHCGGGVEPDFCEVICNIYDNMVKINDFHDFNYENIAFDITNVDKQALEHKLAADSINHLYELRGANYIAVWNCDLQGFKKVEDIYFDSVLDNYTLCKLMTINGYWCYEVVDTDRKVRDDLLLI